MVMSLLLKQRPKSRNKQQYEALDVLWRNDDENRCQWLVRIFDVDGSNENHRYVIPAEKYQSWLQVPLT